MELHAELRSSVTALRSLFGAAACSVALVTDGGDELEFVAANGAGADAITGVRIPVGRGIAGWAVMSGQPIAVRDVAADTRFARDVAESTEYVPSSILAAPVAGADGETIGVMEVLDPSVDEASDWALAVLGTAASLVAQLVGVARSSDGSAPSDGGRDAQLVRQVLAAVDAYRGPSR